jgi:hypothetical protein
MGARAVGRFKTRRSLFLPPYIIYRIPRMTISSINLFLICSGRWAAWREEKRKPPLTNYQKASRGYHKVVR